MTPFSSPHPGRCSKSRYDSDSSRVVATVRPGGDVLLEGSDTWTDSARREQRGLLTPVLVDGRQVQALIDTGAEVTVIRDTLFQELPRSWPDRTGMSAAKLVGADGSSIHVFGVVTLPLVVGGRDYAHRVMPPHLMRWTMTLQGYLFLVRHRTGKEIPHVDCGSRTAAPAFPADDTFKPRFPGEDQESLMSRVIRTLTDESGDLDSASDEESPSLGRNEDGDDGDSDGESAGTPQGPDPPPEEESVATPEAEGHPILTAPVDGEDWMETLAQHHTRYDEIQNILRYIRHGQLPVENTRASRVSSDSQ